MKININIFLLIFLFIILYPLKEGLGPTNLLKPFDDANIGDSLLIGAEGSGSNSARRCEDVHLVNDLSTKLSDRCLNSFYFHLDDNTEDTGYYPCIYNIESGTCKSQINLLDGLNSELRYLQENPVIQMVQTPTQINCDDLDGDELTSCENRRDRLLEMSPSDHPDYIPPEIMERNRIEYNNYQERLNDLNVQINALQSQTLNEDRGPKCKNSPDFETPPSQPDVVGWIDGDDNVISQCDILCGVSEPEDVHGDRQLPCSNRCSTIACGTGYIDKPNVRLDWEEEPTTDLGCSRVTCDDITCNPGYLKKQSPSLSPGVLPTNELCCDQTCENITCESNKGYKNKQSPSLEPGVVPTINECCDKIGDCINDNDCSDNTFKTYCSDEWKCITSPVWWVLLACIGVLAFCYIVIKINT